MSKQSITFGLNSVNRLGLLKRTSSPLATSQPSQAKLNTDAVRDSDSGSPCSSYRGMQDSS